MVSSQIIQRNLGNATTKEMEKVGRAARQWVKYDAAHLQQNFWFLGNNRDLPCCSPSGEPSGQFGLPCKSAQVCNVDGSIDDGHLRRVRRHHVGGGPVQWSRPNDVHGCCEADPVLER